MLQKTYDSQTAKFIAVVVENMPRMSADVMQRWIENPLALKKVLADLCLSKGIESKSTSFITHNFPAILVLERTLKDAIKIGKYYWKDENITEKNFPTSKELFGTKDMALFNFNENISSENASKKMDEAGYRPATLMELITIGEKYPEIKCEFSLIALGSSAKIDDVICVPNILGVSIGTYLRLCDWYDVWLPSFRFLAVRKP